MSTARKIVKRGFTLIETVTTVGIMAAMAAVVIPQVVRQFDSADPTRVQNDLKALQTAISTFRVNIRTQFPGDLDDLTNPILTDPLLANAPDSGLTVTGASLYSATETPQWIGPYVDFATVNEGTRVTGYNGVILDNFVCYNATQNQAGTSGGGGNPVCPGVIGANDRLFVAIRITGLSTVFETINSRFDGPSEGVNSVTLGRVRSPAAGTGIVVGTLYFLALPLN